MGLKIYRAIETEWIEGCKQGNSSAQKSIFDHFSGRMFSLCCRYISDRMVAEDVLITAFTKAFERIHQYKAEGSFEGWLRRIVVNESLTYIRRNKNMYLETELEAADREPDLGKMDTELEAEDLMQLIAALPAGYRMVFNLYAIDGYSHKEIADQLGISENTSKSQLSRARAVLQKSLLDMERATSQKMKEL